MSQLEFIKYGPNINVKREGRICLRIRNILNAMSKDEHYNNEYVKQYKLINLITFIDVTGEMKYFMSVF